MKTFAKNSFWTLITQTVYILSWLFITIVIARVLGPEGKGLHALAILIPTMMVNFANFGIGAATTYHTAKGDFDRKLIFGNDVILSLIIGTLLTIISLLIVLVYGEYLLTGLPLNIALLALLIILPTLFFNNLNNLFLGLQKIKNMNIASTFQIILMFILISMSLYVFNAGLIGIIVATISASFITSLILVFWLFKTLNGINLKVSPKYIKSALSYGLKTSLANIVTYFNYRIDIFLINFFLNPAAVGFYSIGVGIAERLWLASHATSMVLLPKITAEKDERVKQEFTPFISRTVFLITTLGAGVLFFLTKPIVIFLYSNEFAPAIQPLQILLPGIVAVAASRVIAADIAARGKPLLNSYLSFFALIINLILNIIYIPKLGITGAALASSVSYILIHFGRVWLYSRVSGNSLLSVLIPKKSDFVTYRNLTILLSSNLRKFLIFKE